MDDINYLSDKHLQPICKRLANLKQISMWSSARHLSSFSFKQLSSLSKLTTIKLDSNKLVTDDVRHLIFDLKKTKKNLLLNFSIYARFVVRVLNFVICRSPIVHLSRIYR